MRTTHHVFREVNAGRMSPAEGMAHIDQAQDREAEWDRLLTVVRWTIVAILVVALLALVFKASTAEAHAPPLERLPAMTLKQGPDVSHEMVTDAPEEAAKAQAEEARTESLFLKLLGILIVPIGTLLTALLGMLTLWVKSKAANSKLAGGASVLLDLLNAHLAKARAELGPDLKAALADGVLDQAERDALKKKLIDLLLRDAPADALKAVSGVFGPAFAGWLDGKAEQAIDAAQRNFLATGGTVSVSSPSP